jgi:putative FmdB family regulatory protein
MPTYEYRCPEGHEFEHFYRKISDAQSELACPECGKLAERIMSAGAGLVFKGSGFYLTDYGKNAHRKSGGDSAAKASDGGEKSGGGGDSASGEKTVSSVKAVDAKSSESSGKAAESKPSSTSGPSSSSGTKSDK